MKPTAFERETNPQITPILKRIIADEPGTLRARVAEEALRYEGGNPTAFLNLCWDIQGDYDPYPLYPIITDAPALFDKHYVELELMRERADNCDWPIAYRLLGAPDIRYYLVCFTLAETGRLMCFEDCVQEMVYAQM